MTIPPCSLDAPDLRKLADLVETIAGEAAEREVRQHSRLPNQTEATFQDFLSTLRTSLSDWASVRASTGEWTGGRPADVLREEALPDDIANLTLDSAFDYRAQTGGRNPLNYITVNVGFRRRNLLEVSASVALDEMKQGNVVIFSTDPTWVAGVQRKLEGFFRQRQTHWRWLYHSRTYDLLVIFVGFPLALLWANRLDRWLSDTGVPIGDASRVALLVYIVLILLFLFRLIFNYAIRTFPRYEGPRRGPRPGRAAVVFLLLQIAGWFSTLFLDLFKKLL
jgi:hypothetical protein